MRSWSPVRRCLAGAAITAVVVALAADAAVAGEYTVGNCRSDKLNFNTRAFDTFLKGRMKVRRACNPVGSGLRALITQNVVSRGKVPRGAVAGVLMTAPPGTQFTSFRWAASSAGRTAAMRSSSGPRIPTTARCDSRSGTSAPTATARTGVPLARRSEPKVRSPSPPVVRLPSPTGPRLARSQGTAPVSTSFPARHG